MEKIPVIDDEQDVLYSFRRSLDATGREVLTADALQDGIEIFRRQKPDVTVSDIRLGTGASGLDVLSQIRQLDPKALVILFDRAKRDPQFKIIPWVERELIRQALVETKGNQVQASKLLGITRATLRIVPAAERRKIVAHGASRGIHENKGEAPGGAKEIPRWRSVFYRPYRGFLHPDDPSPRLTPWAAFYRASGAPKSEGRRSAPRTTFRTSALGLPSAFGASALRPFLPFALALTLATSLLSASAQSLVLDEAMKASNWHGANGARVGKTVFLSGDGHTGNGMEMELPLVGSGSPLLSLPLTHTNWASFAFLRIRTFTDQPFEMPLRVTLHNGDEGFDCLPAPFGAPGWNEFRLYLRYPGRIDLTRVRALSIKDRSRDVPLLEAQRGRFYLAEMKLIGANDSTSLPPPMRPPDTEASLLRIDLGRYFPAHLPVEKFRFAEKSAFWRKTLRWTDANLFDPTIRSNHIADIQTRVTPLHAQTNNLGILFTLQAYLPPNTTPLRLDAFRSWLTSAYSTIGDLNGRWDSKFARFEEIAWPTDRQPARWRDAVTFWQDTVTRATRDAVAAARGGAPRAYILGIPEVEFENHGEANLLDYYAIQRGAGWSHYSHFTGSLGDSRECLAGGPDRALISTLATRINRRLWALPFHFEWKAPETHLDGRASRWCDRVASRNLWLLLAAGMDGMIVRKPVPQLETALRQTQPLWKVFGGSRSLTRLGIVRSSSSLLMNRDARKEESQFFANFWGFGWQPAVIHEETFRDFPKAPSDYDVLALGGATHLPSWLQESLISWINDGGTLLCDEPPGLFDPWGRRVARLLWETLGIDDVQKDADGRWRLEAARLKPGCSVMASDAAGRPLALRAKYGRGEIVVSLDPFFTVKEIRDYWPQVLNERVKREIESPERNLYLDWRPCDELRTFFSVAINLSPYAPVKTQVIAHGAYSRALNLSADGGANPVPCERTESITSFPLELPPGGGAVLMLERAGKPPRRR